MRRLLQTTFFSMGILLILTTVLLHTQRDGEGVPSLIAVQGQESPRLVMLLPLSHQQTPLTPYMRGLQYVAWTPNGLLYTALSEQGDTVLYRVSHIGATPELLADQLLSRMVVSENGEWVVVADSGGVSGNYGLRAIRTDGSEQHPLTLGLQEDLEINQEMIPVVSPDGTWVAFSVYAPSDDFDVYQVKMDGTGLENLTADIEGTGEPLAWAVDDSGFIFSVNDQLFRAENGTGKLIPLLPDAPPQQVLVAQNKQFGLAIVEVDNQGDQGLYGVKFDTTIAWAQPIGGGVWFHPKGLWGIANNPDHEWVRVWGETGEAAVIERIYADLAWELQWSPDGQSAIVSGDDLKNSWWLWQFYPTSNRFERIWGIRTRLFLDPTWSPDGLWIVAHAMIDYHSELLWIQPEESEPIWRENAQNLQLFRNIHWGPTYEKTWSAGVLLLIGVVCVAGAWMGWPIIGRLISRRRHLA